MVHKYANLEIINCCSRVGIKPVREFKAWRVIIEQHIDF